MDELEDILNRSKAKADAAADPQLEAILGEADRLTKVFDDLKLTDPATYDSLKQIVQEATNRHESVASVIDRVKALGQAGQGLATRIAGLSSGGGLAALRGALGI